MGWVGYEKIFNTLVFRYCFAHLIFYAPIISHPLGGGPRARVGTL